MRQTRIDPAGDTDDVSFDKLKGAPISTTFRKDLAQAIYPLIIDPTTLTSTVRANLRVPEDVFPTITNVPGGAVEFKYWVEVVLDLGGKLRGKLDGRNDLFIGTLPGSAITVGGGGKMGMGSISVEGGVMIETERVRRREKSVVSCRFEVVVGTTDSVGRKGRLAKAIASGRLSEIQERRPSTSTTSQVVSPPSPQPPPPPIHQEAPEYDMSWQPPPIKEKEQLRLAEQLLMPSAPGPSFSLAPSSPGASSSGAGPSSPGPSFAPSAPILEDVEENNRDEDEGGSDDKTERERRRLFGGESLPPGLETSESSAGAASAPLLMEDVDMERLPEYRR